MKISDLFWASLSLVTNEWPDASKAPIQAMRFTAPFSDVVAKQPAKIALPVFAEIPTPAAPAAPATPTVQNVVIPAVENAILPETPIVVTTPVPALAAPQASSTPEIRIANVETVENKEELKIEYKAVEIDGSSVEASAGKPMIQSINEYRSRARLPPLVWDSRLVSNAAKTGDATHGERMQHQMNPGTFGQVLVEGTDSSCGLESTNYTPFEVFYYSWLCENPNDAALQDNCGSVLRTSRIDTGGQIGHWQILSDEKYKKIGCAFTRNQNVNRCSGFTGVWACDLGW